MIIRIKDLQKFYECSYSTAVRYKKLILFVENIKSGHLTIYHLANYEGLSVDVVLKKIVSI